MTFDERAVVFVDLQKEMDRVCHTKSVDYAGKEDMLANFKNIAATMGLTKYQVWSVYFQKHIAAIQHAIKHAPQCPKVESEPMLGRIVDAMNYLRLFQCMLVEDADIEKRKYNLGQSIPGTGPIIHTNDIIKFSAQQLQTIYDQQSAQ